MVIEDNDKSHFHIIDKGLSTITLKDIKEGNSKRVLFNKIRYPFWIIKATIGEIPYELDESKRVLQLIKVQAKSIQIDNSHDEVILEFNISLLDKFTEVIGDDSD